MNAKYHSAVFIDVDGTLVDREGRMPESAISVIAEAQQRGYMVVLTTGRMYASAVREAGRAKIRSDIPVISFNGAFCAPIDNRLDVIHYTPVSGPLYVELINLLSGSEQSDVTIFCYSLDSLFIDCENELLREYADRTGSNYKLLGSFLEISSSPKVLILTRFETPQKLRPIYEKIDGAFKGRLEYVNSFPNYLEVNSPGTTKGAAIKSVIKRYSFDVKSLYAIGDSFNDVEMFSAVGTSIAMGNADVEVKKRALFSTKRLEDDGIAYAFKNFIFKTSRQF